MNKKLVKILILFIITSMILTGCIGNNEINNDSEGKDLEGIKFIVSERSAKYAQYIDHDFHLKVTLPAGHPFFYNFEFGSIIDYQHNGNTDIVEASHKSIDKYMTIDRYLTICYKFEDDDLDRNRIIIRGSVGTAPLEDFGVKTDEYKESSIEINSGRIGRLRSYESEDGMKLSFIIKDG